MTEKVPGPGALFVELKNNPDLRHRKVEPGVLDPRLVLLRQFQSERLARTYAGLMQDPHYTEAGRFFLSDIYAPRDFTQRDHDAARLHEILSRIFPPAVIQLLTTIIELNTLSTGLDLRLAYALFSGEIDDYTTATEITPALYAQGYRVCDNYAERVEQIRLMVAVIRQTVIAAHLPLAGLTLRAAQLPAYAAGWHELHDFVLRGYAAFRKVKSADYFAETVRTREMAILDRIFAGSSDPF